MNKARKKFVLFSGLSVVLLLMLLLTIINVITFSGAADDADILTERIAIMHGSIDKPPDAKEVDGAQNGEKAPASESSGQNNNVRPFRLDRGRLGGMGPNSPEMESSLRYFTYAIDKDGNIEKIDFRMSAVSEEEAEQWALSLQNGTTGWTNVIYRYRVYESGKKTYVTVIDQSRELWPCYRLLMISAVGGALMVIVIFVAFGFLGNKLFKPLEEADRKQKRFISRIENEFKMPLTIINSDTEALERQNEPDDHTKSIDRQVKRMTRLVRELGTLSMFDESDNRVMTDISDMMISMLENKRQAFEEKSIKLTYNIEPGISINVNDDAFKEVMRELITNSLKFSVSYAEFTLERHKDRFKLIQKNDARLPDGSCDQIFDRFTTLSNAEGTSGAGLGLAFVKNIIRSCNGRLSAAVRDGSMIITIDL